MRRLILLTLLILLIIQNAFSVQIIMETDIARWYLNADLVIVCTANKIDTLYISKFDSTTSDSIQTQYEIVQEKYAITVDSMIKNDDSLIDISCIYSPEIAINYSNIKYLGFYELDTNGDSIFRARDMSDFCSGDDSYVRLKLNKKQIVMLSKTDYGYIIDYQCDYNAYIIDLIRKVQKKGQSFIDNYGKFPDI
jgi:hypothetical protein